MIYPLVYNTITQYRGPRFDSELAKLFNSIVFDVNKGFSEIELQESQINEIMNMHINGANLTSIRNNTSLDIQEVGVSDVVPTMYNSINQFTSRLDNIEVKAKQFIESIY